MGCWTTFFTRYSSSATVSKRRTQGLDLPYTTATDIRLQVSRILWEWIWTRRRCLPTSMVHRFENCCHTQSSRSLLVGHPERPAQWIPACAGMTYGRGSMCPSAARTRSRSNGLAFTVVCWSGICGLGSIEIGSLGSSNTLPFDHKSGSRESQLGLLPDISKPPISPQ